MKEESFIVKNCKGFKIKSTFTKMNISLHASATNVKIYVCCETDSCTTGYFIQAAS